MLHEQSPRAQKRFIDINCSAIPENLVESELFGHEKGAFTGAAARKTGLIEAADGGTVFLDELRELGHVVQRSEEQTSELQSLMRISYAVFCLKKKKTTQHTLKRYSSV